MINYLKKKFSKQDIIQSDIQLDSDFMKIYSRCKPFTMVPIEGVYALYESCKYIVNNDIPGDLVECGVWKGGCVMVMAYTLLALGAGDRKVYLFDTFEGMSMPKQVDIDLNSSSAESIYQAKIKKGGWLKVSEREVKKNLYLTGFEKKNLFFVKGKVEDTIPCEAPKEIALLRLDTDWYASTYHELVHLYPRLAKSGILIVDDYGHWQGAKMAVDEYFIKNRKLAFLNRIDYSGRLLIKQI